MLTLIRSSENPILLPSTTNDWERRAAFNGSVVKSGNSFHMVYRALSQTLYYQGHSLALSTVGYAESKEGIHFTNHRQLIVPEFVWEVFGCEDPRITFFEGRYYIFYTALSNYPFNADGIKVAVAISSDLKTINEKHLVTPFNAKAMCLFPERINGKIVAILAANTDRPPAKISLAFFDSIEELWSQEYWENWYAYLDDHTLPLMRNSSDQVEVGAVPIKTERGWLLIYSDIKDYYTDNKKFGIEAALLDLKNPVKIRGRTDGPLLIPETDYEKFGEVQNIVFPTGAVISDKTLYVYYGAADTSCAVATIDSDEIINSLVSEIQPLEKDKKTNMVQAKKFEENPIITPIAEHPWENKATFNPAAIYEGGIVHIIYRAMSQNNMSVFGYATSNDGFHIIDRLPDPVYIPREIFEKNIHTDGNSGCEDPRITKIGNRYYMLYTAYDGINPPRVAMTSIAVQDLLNRKWHWAIPKLISPPEIDDKDACIFPKKFHGKFCVLHRLQSAIWIDFIDDLHFYEGQYLGGSILFQARPDKWDDGRIGISSVPIETKDGWILLYHGVTNEHYYKVSAALLDLHNPNKVLSRLDYPILEPEYHYEKDGQVPNVVFPCGSVVIDDTIFMYYGGGDTTTAVATVSLSKLLHALKKSL